MKTFRISLLLAISLSFAALPNFLIAAESEPPSESAAIDEAKLFQEGKHDKALAQYKAGYKLDKNKRCLEGIIAVAIAKRGPSIIAGVIDDVMKRAEDDSTFLMVGVGFAAQTKDENLFRKCLGLARPEWLEINSMLTYGLARGSIVIFGDKDGIQNTAIPQTGHGAP